MSILYKYKYKFVKKEVLQTFEESLQVSTHFFVFIKNEVLERDISNHDLDPFKWAL